MHREKMSRGRKRTQVTREAEPRRSDAEGYDSIHPVAFRPSAKQITYLDALRAAVMCGENYSDAAIQRATRISRMTMWEWKRDPAFVAWVTAETKLESDRQWELAVARHLALAIKGSVRSFEALIRLRSLTFRSSAFEPLDDEPASKQDYKVVILCPRPPALPDSGSGVNGATTES